MQIIRAVVNTQLLLVDKKKSFEFREIRINL